MEKFLECADIAKSKLVLADHMLTVTYPLIKDPKILLQVLQNMKTSLENSFSSLLYYERLWKRIPLFNETYSAKLDMFKRMAPKYGVDRKYLTMIDNVNSTLKAHKESPVEFARKNRYVICSQSYRDVKSISDRELKSHMVLAKEFTKLMEEMIKRDDRITHKRP
ncbi:hypothetical protein JW868_03010 [Candidatus Woesearchaeota archaeon]|nr:hypothetical protein [Candidatus Woesearchaeota archaeon]